MILVTTVKCHANKITIRIFAPDQTKQITVSACWQTPSNLIKRIKMNLNAANAFQV